MSGTETPAANRLEQQLRFLREIDKLKAIVRRNRLLDGSRRENAAEHSWHLAVAAMVLAELAPNPSLDLGRVLRMLLIHDIVEIDAGDHFYYNDNAQEQHEQEKLAAQRLFGLLPPDQAQAFRALWEEFEDGRTPEAAFARALDRFQPLYANCLLDGGTWREFGVTRADIETRSAPLVQRGAPALWEHCRRLLDDLSARGLLPAERSSQASRTSEPHCPTCSVEREPSPGP